MCQEVGLYGRLEECSVEGDCERGDDGDICSGDGG